MIRAWALAAVYLAAVTTAGFAQSRSSGDCGEVVTWYVMKTPIEMSESQIQEYARHYHNTARPIQPLNARPVVESQ